MVADKIRTVLDLFALADIDTDAGIKLQRSAAGRYLGIAVHDADLFTELVYEHNDTVRFGNCAGQLTQCLRHEPRMKTDM